MIPLLILLDAWNPAFGAEEVPDDVAKALSAVLRRKAETLRETKLGDGPSKVRGTFSDNFKRINDSRWSTVFFKDTAEADRLRSERYEVVLSKNPSGAWTVAEETLESTFDRLERDVAGRDSFERFSSFSFDREGMKIRATHGEIVIVMRNGKPRGFLLGAPDLAYEFRLPRPIGHYDFKKRLLVDRRPLDFVFEPEFLRVGCDEHTCREFLETALSGRTEIGAGESFASELSLSALREAYQESRSSITKRLKSDPFAFFAAPDPPDRRYWNLAIKRRKGEEHYVGLRYDNDEAWDVVYWASGYGAIFGYHSERVSNEGQSPGVLERREDAEARLYDVVSVVGRVDLAIAEAEELFADLTFKLRIKRTQADYPFSISRLRQRGQLADVKNPTMVIHSIRDAAGEDLTWVRTGPTSGRLVFPSMPEAGSEVTLRIRFTSLDSIIRLMPTYSYVDRSGWLPFVRFGDMIDEFELEVRTPERYTPIGIGTKVSERRIGRTIATRWVARSPVNFPTVIFGEYISAEPRIKATKKDGTDIPVRVHLDRDSTSIWGVRPKQLRAIAEQAVNALNLYREAFGVDYPYDKLDLVNDPGGPALYGQAPASIVYLGAFVFRGEGALRGSTATRFAKDVVAHEVAHQWWGSLITSANERNYWFIESLAEFSSAIFVENVYGPEKYAAKLADWRKTVLDADLLEPVQTGYALYGGDSGGRAPFPPQAAIYSKGPYAFHILRETLGDDTLLWKVLGAIAHELSGREVTTTDLQQAAERALSTPLGWFFDQWIRGVGLPEYTVSYSTRRTEEGDWLVEGTIRQRVLFGKDKVELSGVYFDALGRISIETHDGETLRGSLRPVRGPETTFRVRVEREPARVHFNRDGEILSHDVIYRAK